MTVEEERGRGTMMGGVGDLYPAMFNFGRTVSHPTRSTSATNSRRIVPTSSATPLHVRGQYGRWSGLYGLTIWVSV